MLRLFIDGGNSPPRQVKKDLKMTKYYFTTDTDYTILENAAISFVEAETEKDAVALIQIEFEKSYPDLEEEDQIMSAVEGDFSDCWFKARGYNDQDIEELELAPFSKDQLSISYPGSHPGGNCYWINPNETIYVPKILEK